VRIASDALVPCSAVAGLEYQLSAIVEEKARESRNRCHTCRRRCRRARSSRGCSGVGSVHTPRPAVLIGLLHALASLRTHKRRTAIF
jgi:hypothetical protein